MTEDSKDIIEQDLNKAINFLGQNKFSEAETSKVNALNAQNTIAVNEANAKREASLNQYNATLENQRQQNIFSVGFAFSIVYSQLEGRS